MTYLRRKRVGYWANIRDFTELFLVPSLAAMLPWSLCFRLFHRLVKLKSLYRRETDAALAGFATIGPVADAKAWSEAARMVGLVDHADVYLSLFRRDGWLHRHVTVTGDWPVGDTPFIAITFHWGAGMWALRHLRAQGRKVSVLVRGVEKKNFSGSLLRYGYAKLRLHEVARAGGSSIVISGKKSLYEMKAKLKAGHCVVGLIDVPVGNSRNYLATRLLGETAYFPRGLLHLAVSSGVPVVVYSMGLDRQNGQRSLIVSPPLEFINEGELLEALAGRLTDLIKADSPAWHHWGSVQSFFQKG